MNPRSTLPWVVAATLLLGCVLLQLRYGHKPKPPPMTVLPGFVASEVTRVQVFPKGKLEIRAERTNETWVLTEPLRYPAYSPMISNFLAMLERLVPATYIQSREIKDRTKADEDFGFAEPQASLFIQQRDQKRQVKLGSFTTPGDQVFLQVVGVDGIYVVDAQLMKMLPRTADDWRDPMFFRLSGEQVDHIALTNAKVFCELQRNSPANLWSISVPLALRANNRKIEDAIEHLQATRVIRFVSDDIRSDAESFGLQPPELVVSFSKGTNPVSTLQFGKTATNLPPQVYGRVAGGNTIVAIPEEAVAFWRSPLNDLRDPHLLSFPLPIQQLDIRARETFSVLLTNGGWRIEPQGLIADPVLVKELLSTMGDMQILDYTKEVVTDADLATYGLATPVAQYVFRSNIVAVAGGATSAILVQLAFGTNQEGKVFARRADESSVYAVKPEDFAHLKLLGFASWQLRERLIWEISTNEVAAVTVRNDGRTRRLIRSGPYKWAPAAGTQGIVQDLAVEETVRGLCQLGASLWAGHGQEDRAKFGFEGHELSLTLELKSGTNAVVEFGAEASPGFEYASVKLQGEWWIFEIPWPLYRDVQTYISAPPGSP